MSTDIGVFLLVEGKHFDPAYYDQLCNTDASLKTAGVLVRRIDHIMPAGGKDAIDEFFAYCRSRRKLQQTNSSGKRSIIFAMDQDHAGSVGRGRRSQHVIYTDMADVEGEILAHGNLSRALEFLLSVTGTEAQVIANSLHSWRHDLATAWREWHRLCLLVAHTGVRCTVEASKPSWINVPTYGAVDSRKQATAEHEIRKRVGVADFQNADRFVSARVRAIYRRDPTRLLKGKIAAKYLIHRIEAAIANMDVDRTSLNAHTLLKLMFATVDFSEQWAVVVQQRVLATLQ